MCDPNNETPALAAFSYKQLLHAPLVSGGLWTATVLPFISAFGLWPAFGLSTGVIGLWLLAYFFHFKKKYRRDRRQKRISDSLHKLLLRSDDDEEVHSSDPDTEGSRYSPSPYGEMLDDDGPMVGGGGYAPIQSSPHEMMVRANPHAANIHHRPAPLSLVAAPRGNGGGAGGGDGGGGGCNGGVAAFGAGGALRTTTYGAASTGGYTAGSGF
jgi:hypothetical protein